MKSYHFDLGDSGNGPIGACFRVKANSREEAVAKVRDRIAEMVDLCRHMDVGDDFEYANVYINVDNITVEDIDDEEDCDE